MFAADLYFTPQTPQSIDAEVCVNTIETYLIFLRKGGKSGEKSRGLAAHAFQCQDCRLISNPGDAANEADYASIGVWKG